MSRRNKDSTPLKYKVGDLVYFKRSLSYIDQIIDVNKAEYTIKILYRKINKKWEKLDNSSVGIYRINDYNKDTKLCPDDLKVELL